MLVAALLEEANHVAVEFETGESALAGLVAAAVDLVLLDISLPNMSGTEVLKQLRARPELSSLPVIALTAHAMKGDRESYLAIGFDSYVAKPILDENDLFSAIDALLAPGRS